MLVFAPFQRSVMRAIGYGRYIKVRAEGSSSPDVMVRVVGCMTETNSFYLKTTTVGEPAVAKVQQWHDRCGGIGGYNCMSLNVTEWSKVIKIDPLQGAERNQLHPHLPSTTVRSAKYTVKLAPNDIEEIAGHQVYAQIRHQETSASYFMHIKRLLDKDILEVYIEGCAWYTAQIVDTSSSYFFTIELTGDSYA